MNNNKSKKGFKTMTNIYKKNGYKATKEEHQKRKEAFTKVKEYWAKNDNEIAEIREEIRQLSRTINNFENEIQELINKSSQYYKDNFRKYYPDKLGSIKETDTKEEMFRKDAYWRGYNVIGQNGGLPLKDRY
tara:strand:+ start:197 stop:592 length:396 start_codon:yes stop_codon:yes gene_type:complete